jgi:hypothetical protein
MNAPVATLPRIVRFLGTDDRPEASTDASRGDRFLVRTGGARPVRGIRDAAADDRSPIISARRRRR